MELPKRRILMNVFFKAQFNYCPFASMFHLCSLNNKIDRLLKRRLRIHYNDKRSSFEELSVRDHSFSVHRNNIHTVATEMYKVVNDITPEIINDVFKLRDDTDYALRHTKQFLVDPFYSVFNGNELASYLGLKIWE